MGVLFPGAMSKRSPIDFGDDYEKSYAAKKSKPAIPSHFPNPHAYMEKIRHPWESEFEALSTELRLKPNWTEKIFDEEILAKWKEEISCPWMWSRLVAELQYLAKLKDADAEPSSVDRVWLKDAGIPEELHKKFVDLVATRLETKEKEFHPNSNNTVVDLIHPSLYCYVHGETRVCEEPNHSQLTSKEEWKSFISSPDAKPAENPTLQESLKVIEEAKKIQRGEKPKPNYHVTEDDEENEPDYRVKLDPALFFVSHESIDEYDADESAIQTNDDRRAMITNLAGIYRWIPADIAVDMFGKVKFNSYINGLHPFEEKELYEVIAEIMNYFIPLWGNVLADISSDPPAHAENRVEYQYDEQELYGISDDTLGCRYDEALERGEKDVEVLKRFEEPVRNPPVELARSNLKVIVKIASIELTPENPSYIGSWHIEGVPEEAVISTGIYYFAEENIADNFLHFRLAHGDPDCTSVQCPMGLGFGCVMNRDAGKVQTKFGRLLCFPNIMQHCLKEARLEDATKPGYRKILVFFLVDPNKEVVSSGTVPPPCKAWAEAEGIPTDDISFQSLEQARNHRENLMFTRKFYVVSQNETIFERECTFCEH